MSNDFATLFCLLVFGHMLADYPLQGDFLARAKNRKAPIPGFPFWQALTAHAIIHGGFVFVITGNIWMGLGEVFVHWITDDLKCMGKIGLNTDQAIHIFYKLVWAAIAVHMAAP